VLKLTWLKGKGYLNKPNEQIFLSGTIPISFGADHHKNLVSIKGERITPKHFEIKYHKAALRIVNLSLNEAESCGVYKKLLLNEEKVLQPADAFRIGKLEFVVERFNTGIVSDIG